MPPAGLLLKYAIVALISWAVLNPAVEARIIEVIEHVEGAFTKGVTKPVVNAWIEVAVIAAGLGFAIWIIEAKTAKHMGQEVSAPPVASIGVAAPPTFGGTGGIGVSPAGVSADTRVTATGGSMMAGGVGEPGRPTRSRRAKRSGFAA